MAYKRILCAVDFSEESNLAFRQAVELARQNSARLFLLHAMELRPVVSQWMSPDHLGEVTLRIEEEAKHSMEALSNSARSGLKDIPVHTEITSGRAFEEILENARVWNADLVVMGNKGLASLERIILGSTVERVLKESECSVLVVKKKSS